MAVEHQAGAVARAGQAADGIEAVRADGHEIAAHGYLHEHPNKLPDKEKERYWLQRQVAVIEKMTGKRPRGWRGPGYNASKFSIDLLAEEGFLYDSTLMGDDVPYVLRTARGSVIELPSDWAMDDWPHYTHNPDLQYMMPIKSPGEAMNVFMAEFDAMYEFGGLWVTVWHPFVSGRLARCVRVKKMIVEMLDRGGVWFATLEDIARHVQKCIDDGSWQPRVDDLPYYEGLIPELAAEAAE